MLSDHFHYRLPADNTNNTIFWGIIIIFSLAFIPYLAKGEFPLTNVKIKSKVVP